jgi:hypothetical protein
MLEMQYRNLKINTKYNVYIFSDFTIVVLYATMLNTDNVLFCFLCSVLKNVFFSSDLRILITHLVSLSLSILMLVYI